MEQATQPNTMLLDVARMAPFEIGAHLEALVCHPEKNPDARRRLADAIGADLVSQMIDCEPDRARELRSRYPRYKKSLSRASLGTQGKRWDAALTAGVFFLAQIKKAATGEHPILEGVAKPFSGRKLTEVMLVPDEGGELEQFESRLHDALRNDVRRFYPVAHLAAAYQYIARVACGANVAGTFDPEDLDFHRMVVQLSARFAQFIRETPALDGAASKLIDIEWRD